MRFAPSKIISLFASGTISTVLGGYIYNHSGYSVWVVFFWIASIILFAAFFYKREKYFVSIAPRDILIGIGLILVFAPIYFLGLSSVPYQMNTDELTITYFSKQLAHKNTDIFSLSSYFYFPTFIFALWGWLARLLGGVTVYHIRILHALSGLCIIAASYFFFRLFWGRLLAISGAVLVGSNHALLAISRMAMRDNVALLIEVVSLSLLLRGFQKKSFFETFLGGAMAGLGFYNYFPARIVIFLWLLFLLSMAMFFRGKYPFVTLFKNGSVSFFGFLVVIIPLGIATLKTPGFGAVYSREQIMIFSEGQKLQKSWNNSGTIIEAFYDNVKKGLLVFNENSHDHGYIYPNYGHGFVDPISGILLWIGLVFFLFKLKKRPEEMLIVGSFLFLYFFYALFLTKNPNYTRYLLLLPFVAGLIIGGLERMGSFLESFVPYFGRTLVVLIIVAGALSNFQIFYDFVSEGFVKGNDVGGTARYIEERFLQKPYTFYLVADSVYPFYSWGAPHLWKTWMEVSLMRGQNAEVIDPESVLTYYQRPFTIFMNQTLWARRRDQFKELYPAFEIRPIKPDGSLLAIEVP